MKSKEISEDEEKKFEKIIQDFTDDNIKIIDDKVSSKERNNDNMNSPYVSIIMDGNGRWEKKRKFKKFFI